MGTVRISDSAFIDETNEANNFIDLDCDAFSIENIGNDDVILSDFTPLAAGSSRPYGQFVGQKYNQRLKFKFARIGEDRKSNW